MNWLPAFLCCLLLHLPLSVQRKSSGFYVKVSRAQAYLPVVWFFVRGGAVLLKRRASKKLVYSAISADIAINVGVAATLCPAQLFYNENVDKMLRMSTYTGEEQTQARSKLVDQYWRSVPGNLRICFRHFMTALRTLQVLLEISVVHGWTQVEGKVSALRLSAWKTLENPVSIQCSSSRQPEYHFQNEDGEKTVVSFVRSLSGKILLQRDDYENGELLASSKKDLNHLIEESGGGLPEISEDEINMALSFYGTYCDDLPPGVTEQEYTEALGRFGEAIHFGLGFDQ